MQFITHFAGQMIVIEPKDNETVAEWKKRSYYIFGRSFDGIALWCNGKFVPDTTVMSTLPPMALLDWSVPLPGGKVHGSLARAGKVKGQTPKVEKQEKRKPKTGRAKRRQQFNRRFMQTTKLNFQRRRGPNAQKVD